ncbi:MAG: Gfo/Idh/MocA family oxidoreductase [Rhizobacter sp.]|nr:Gfo/Idh/MocA family oxidoreductase [Chlorobiales bacterium]
MSKIGIAFLGSGFAQSVQAPAFAMTEQVALIGAASPNSAEKFAAAFKMPVHTSDWKSLVSRDDVHLVCVSSPPSLHCEQTLFALGHGKHVLCEKPFAMNLAEAKAMRDAAAGKNLLAVIDHELRFAPERRFVREFLRQGKLGKLYFAEAAAHLSGRRTAAKPAFTWWSDKTFGGGVWGAIASHLIDQLRFFTGGEVAETSARLHTAVTERPAKDGGMKQVTSDDVAMASLRLASGAPASVFASVVSAEDRIDIELTGEAGTIKVDMMNRVYFREAGKSYEEIKADYNEAEQAVAGRLKSSAIGGSGPFPKAFALFADKIIRALQAGETSITDAATFEDGVKIQEVLDAANWSEVKT